jgi:hypothetical protein
MSDEVKAKSAIERVRDYRRFNVLSLDGGGIRGTIEAVVLDRLSREYPKLLQNVDLIAGSSTGGIQALGLAAGNTAPENREAYTSMAKLVFADSFLDDFRDLWKLGGADYSTKNIRRALQMQFGDMVLRDLDKKVAITAFQLDSGPESAHRGWKLKVFHNFDNPDSDGDERIVNVACRTSAAPVYFPTVDGYVDGGVVANNPALVGIAQALNAERGGGAPFESINVFSLGAGRSGRWVKGKNHDWGALQWAPHILFMMLEGSVDATDFQCRQLLGDRYFRLNPDLTDNIRLDDWKKIPDLVELANEIDLEKSVRWLEERWV